MIHSPPPPPIPPREHHNLRSPAVVQLRQQQQQQHQHSPLRATPSSQSSASRSQQSSAMSGEVAAATLHDLSQDSGVASGASPAMPAGQQQTGVYDNYRVIAPVARTAAEEEDPQHVIEVREEGVERDAARVSLRRSSAESPSGSGRWRGLGGFFRRKGSGKRGGESE